MKELPWEHFKSFVDQRGLSIQWVELDNTYYMWALDGVFGFSCQVYKDGSEAEFESSYKDASNVTPRNTVTTMFELDDKTLRTICMFSETDTNGVARFAVKVPEGGRYVAYGDVEFQEREFGDYVSKIEVVDLDRLIAWQMALAADPQAQAPLDDATVQSASEFPLYPVLGHYDERAVEVTANTSGTPNGGMAMTFQYGVTQSEPIGGYAFIPGNMYFVVECTKAMSGSGKKCQLSIDWAEKK